MKTQLHNTYSEAAAMCVVLDNCVVGHRCQSADEGEVVWLMIGTRRVVGSEIKMASRATINRRKCGNKNTQSHNKSTYGRRWPVYTHHSHLFHRSTKRKWFMMCTLYCMYECIGHRNDDVVVCVLHRFLPRCPLHRPHKIWYTHVR